MTRSVLALCFLLASHWAMAQDLALTNARVIDGSGRVLESGTVVVRAGLIAAISDASVSDLPVQQIDVGGMTVMPGLIDSHTHLLLAESNRGGEAALSHWIADELPGHLEAYLEAGVTTVFSHGDYFPAIVDVKRRLADGELGGPRLLLSGPFVTTRDGHPIRMLCGDSAGFCRETMMVEVESPAAARSIVRDLADAGVDAIKVVYDDGLSSNPFPELSDDVLAAIADETEKRSLLLIAHARETVDALKVVDFGVTRLAHPPVLGVASLAELGQVLRDRAIPFATTSNWGLDGIRELWDAGATVAFGTDGFGPRGPRNSVSREVNTIGQVMAPAEVIAAMTKNAATYLGLEASVGTLETGKLADIVVIDGDPLAQTSDLTNVVMTIQGGRVIFDNR